VVADPRLRLKVVACESPRSSFTPIGQLLNESDEAYDWLADCLLVAGGTSLVVAKPKTGKSVLVQNLAASVAQGRPFLGHGTRQGTVLYCALEEKRGEVRRHFRALELQANDPLYVHVGRSPDDALAWLETETDERRPVLIVVDTLQHLVRLADLNDYAAVTNALAPLTHLARTSGAHLLMTHHGNKRGGTNGDGVLGSTGLFGAVDTLIQMRRTDSARVISSIQRYGEDLPESVLEMEPETFGLSISGTRAEADGRELEAAICDYLATCSEPVGENTLGENVEGRTAIKRTTLRKLVESGEVRREGDGKKGSPFLYSRFLVPCIGREQENENHELPLNARPDAINTCSLESQSIPSIVAGPV